MRKRGNGVLLHVSSLPSEFGIGDFGPSAFRFIDFLKKARQSYWQILPLHPTEAIFGDSPYSSVSAFAGNLLFI
ncbi:MAG: 4-alpha-glucanotransferase, partial [Candidatus Omnitrophota bacterium]